MTGGAERGLVEVDRGAGGGGAIMVLVEEEEVIGSMGVGVGVREVLALAAFGVDGKLEMPCSARLEGVVERRPGIDAATGGVFLPFISVERFLWTLFFFSFSFFLVW